jgi:hypothetical protein
MARPCHTGPHSGMDLGSIREDGYVAIQMAPRTCADCGGPTGNKPAARCRACYDVQRPLKVTMPPGLAACRVAGWGSPRVRCLSSLSG